MRTKKVSRYWCDHCNRAGLQLRAMTKHEERCTKNPERKCGFCEFTGESESIGLAGLLVMLPDPKGIFTDTDGVFDEGYRVLKAEINAIENSLREAADNCPACIMAAFRQKGIPVPFVDWFNYKEESAGILNDVQKARFNDVGGY